MDKSADSGKDAKYHITGPFLPGAQLDGGLYLDLQ